MSLAAQRTPLIAALEQLGPHDHLCSIYESPQEHYAVAVPFIRIGLDRGEKCIYIADDGTVGDVRQAMQSEGICSALRQYNRRLFPPELLLDVIRTHPMVVYGGTVCRNLYHVPPDEFLGTNQTAREVERLLTNIRERERVEDALREQLTERKRADEALREAQVELAHVTRVTTIGELAAAIAHEINQPLAAVITNGSAC